MSNTITVAILLSNATARNRAGKDYLKSWFFNEGATYVSSCTKANGENMLGGMAYPSFDDEQFRIPYAHLKVNSGYKGRFIETALEVDAWGTCKTLAFNDPFRGPVPFELIFDLQGQVGEALGITRGEEWDTIEEKLFTGYNASGSFTRIDGTSILGTAANVEPSLKEDVQLLITFEVGANLLEYGDTLQQEGNWKRLQVIPNPFIKGVKVVKKGEPGWLNQLNLVGAPVEGSFTAGSTVSGVTKSVTMKQAVVAASSKKARKAIEGAIRSYWKKEVWDKMQLVHQQAFATRSNFRVQGKPMTKAQFVVFKLKASPDWADFRALDLECQKRVIARLTEWKVSKAQPSADAQDALNALSAGIQQNVPASVEDIFCD